DQSAICTAVALAGSDCHSNSELARLKMVGEQQEWVGSSSATKASGACRVSGQHSTWRGRYYRDNHSDPYNYTRANNQNTDSSTDSYYKNAYADDEDSSPYD
ncbi:hypothetical protein JG688_00011707, partial [Phytophthora aleatoria]